MNFTIILAVKSFVVKLLKFFLFLNIFLEEAVRLLIQPRCQLQQLKCKFWLFLNVVPCKEVC